MTITRDRLREAADRFLDTLEENDIASFQDIERAVGQNLKFRPMLEEHVRIKEDSTGEGKFLTLEYVIPGEGRPIEVKVNTGRKYTVFFLRCEERVNGYYHIYDMNGGGDVFLQRKIYRSGFDILTDELKRLKK